MERSLTVTIDASTWPKGGPRFPRAFHRGARQCDINIPAMLLALGYLTTPPQSSGASLSEYWAWVRYFCAISDEPDLRLTNEFSELDPHQKTILSDDFGMAVPIYWLVDALRLGPITDGRYFIDRLAPLVGATAERPARRGPRKSPDFIAQDHRGRWHVIECKGTQSGLYYRNGQLGDPRSPTRGAVSQKRTITFPAGSTGQRLACGLFVAFEGGDEPSDLRIIDPPEEEEPFLIDKTHEPLAIETVHRAVGGRSLLLSGFRSASSALVQPWLRGVTPQELRERDADAHREFVSEKIAQVEDELESRDTEAAFAWADDRYAGRATSIELPRTVYVKETPVRRVFVRHGVNLNFLDDLARHPLVEQPLHETEVAWQDLVGKTVFDFDQLEAVLRLGSLFVSEVSLQG